MTPDEFADLSRDGLIALVRDATAEILSHQDAQRFLAWMVEHAAGYLGAALAESPDEGAQRAIATVLGRGIWNATPLPDNDFRPRALPEPGRNDPCPCGSGRKYKHCCASVDELPKPEPDEVWLIAVEHFSEAQLAQAIARNRVPPAALAERGLKAHGAFEVENSSWARALEARDGAGRKKHFVFTFRDSVFECVANDIGVELIREDDDTIKLMSKRLYK